MNGDVQAKEMVGFSKFVDVMVENPLFALGMLMGMVAIGFIYFPKAAPLKFQDDPRYATVPWPFMMLPLYLISVGVIIRITGYGLFSGKDVFDVILSLSIIPMGLALLFQLSGWKRYRGRVRNDGRFLWTPFFLLFLSLAGALLQSPEVEKLSLAKKVPEASLSSQDPKEEVTSSDEDSTKDGTALTEDIRRISTPTPPLMDEEDPFDANAQKRARIPLQGQKRKSPSKVQEDPVKAPALPSKKTTPETKKP